MLRFGDMTDTPYFDEIRGLVVRWESAQRSDPYPEHDVRELLREEGKMTNDSLALAKKRVQVARDVIKQVEAGRFQATSETYIENVRVGDRWRVGVFTAEELRDDARQARDIFRKFQRCDVCAKGSLFIAVVDRFNRITIGQLKSAGIVDDIYGTDDPSAAIDWLFDSDQLNMIEASFEGFRGGPSSFEECFIEDANTRLAEIMQNVLANNGTFVREQFRVRCEALTAEQQA